MALDKLGKGVLVTGTDALHEGGVDLCGGEFRACADGFLVGVGC